jgi:cell division protein FtsN
MLSQRFRCQRLPDSHPRSRDQSSSRGRGATPVRRPSSRRQISGWVWLVAGFGGGMLMTSLIHLIERPAPGEAAPALPAAVKVAPPAPVVPEPRRETKEAMVESVTAAPEAEPATRFDFYTLLPEREVIVPDQREPARQASAPAATPAPATRPVAPSSVETAPVVAADQMAPAGEAYLLQAGSFRGAAEAERRRALIAGFGLSARIETVRAGSDTWYRVHAGPFTSRDQLANARERLSAEGIETLQIRQK